ELLRGGAPGGAMREILGESDEHPAKRPGLIITSSDGTFGNGSPMMDESWSVTGKRGYTENGKAHTATAELMVGFQGNIFNVSYQYNSGKSGGATNAHFLSGNLPTFMPVSEKVALLIGGVVAGLAVGVP